jgi:hypothetical protein
MGGRKIRNKKIMSEDFEISNRTNSETKIKRKKL